MWTLNFLWKKTTEAVSIQSHSKHLARSIFKATRNEKKAMYTALVEEQNEVDFCSSNNLSAEEAGLAMPPPNT
jgi:hypothetical protein